MPFKLSEMYVSMRKSANRFVQDYIAIIIWGILGGAFAYFVWSEFYVAGGILNADGVLPDSNIYGAFICTVAALVAHWTILRFIRHWDVFYLCWWIFSIFWIPFDLWNED